MVISQLLVEVFMGGLTGYLTNDWAIKGLFKKGGVVEQTRDDFTREASRLLEEKIITQDVLSERLDLPEVRVALGEVLKNFLMTHLPEVLAEHRLTDLPEEELLVAEATHYLLGIWQRERENLAQVFFKQVKIEKVLDDHQFEVLAKEISAALALVFAQGEYGEKLISRWLQQAWGMTWSELGLDEVVDQILGELIPLSSAWLVALKRDYAQELEGLLLDLMVQLDVEELLVTLENEIKVHSLGDYLTIDGQRLGGYLTEFVRGSEGQGILRLLVDQMVDLLIDIEMPLMDLISEEMLGVLTPFLSQQLPGIMSQLVNWLHENQQLLNELIEEAIDESFEGEEGLKGMVLQMVKETILHNAAAEYDVVARIGEFLSAYANDPKAVDGIIEKCKDLLTTWSVGGLVGKLDTDKGTLRQVIVTLLEENLLFYLANEGEQQLAAWLAKPIGQWLKIPLAQTYGAEVMAKVVTYLLEGLDGVLVQNWTAKKIRDVQCTLRAQTLAATFGKDWAQWAAKGEAQIETWLRKGELPLKEWLGDLDGMSKAYLPKMDGMIVQGLAKWFAQYEQVPWDGMYRRFFTSERVEEILPAGIAFLQQKIALMAAGQLRPLAERSFSQLSNEAILTLVQDFMGRELKPLNYLGAGLGAGVGLVTGGLLIGPFAGLMSAGPSGMLGLLGGKALAFGAVGYGTNCAAIKGLFWPYRPVGGVNCLQGVIPKQQKRFADSLGRMVAAYVLNEDILQDLLLCHNDAWLAKGVALGQESLIAKGVWDKIKSEHLFLEEAGYRGIVGLERRYLPQGLLKLGDLPTTSCYFENLPDHLPKVLERLTGELTKKLADFCGQEVPVAHYMSSEQILAAYPWAEGAVGRIKALDLTDLWRRYDGVYQSWQGQSLSEVVSTDTLAKWTAQSGRWVLNALAGERVAQVVTDGCNSFFGRQSVEKSFQGRITQWLEKNCETILQIAIGHLMGYLRGHAGHLTEQIQSEIKAQLNFLEQMGYRMMNGDALVGKMVDCMIEVKAPAFLGSKQVEISQVILDYWQSTLSSLTMGELAISFNERQVKALLGNILALPGVCETVLSVMNRLGQGIDAIPLDCYLAHTVLGRWESGAVALSEPISIVEEWLKERVKLPMVERALATLVPFLDQQLKDVSLKDLCGGLTLDYWQGLDWQMLWQLGESGEQLERFGRDVLAYGGERPLLSWFDWPQLSVDLANEVDGFLASRDFQVWWQGFVGTEIERGEEIVVDLSSGANGEMILGWIIQGFLVGLSHDGTKVLQGLDLAELTSARVQAMDPKELEQLVRGFSAQYFSHIQNMGWMGAVFAIPGILLQYFL